MLICIIAGASSVKYQLFGATPMRTKTDRILVRTMHCVCNTCLPFRERCIYIYIYNKCLFLFIYIAREKENKHDGLSHSAFNFLFFFLVIASNKSSIYNPFSTFFSSRTVSFDVSQGSILDPLLYNILIADLSSTSLSSMYINVYSHLYTSLAKKKTSVRFISSYTQFSIFFLSNRSQRVLIYSPFSTFFFSYIVSSSILKVAI